MTKHLSYSSWLLRVIAWDGLMPIGVALIPTVIKILTPNRGVLEITAIVTPVMMFVLRLIVGKNHIARNHCSEAVRSIQVCVFFVGIFVLAFVEGVVILSHLMPNGTFKSEDLVVFAVLVSVYLTSMIIAMYPGRVSLQDALV
jgi:hypothetical protein